ncbi:MAG: hypothetical protein IKN87_02210 [Bacilli bacterium]|nr:hypothetical protein [Bacilli bacterium]
MELLEKMMDVIKNEGGIVFEDNSAAIIYNDTVIVINKETYERHILKGEDLVNYLNNHAFEIDAAYKDMEEHELTDIKKAM